MSGSVDLAQAPDVASVSRGSLNSAQTIIRQDFRVTDSDTIVSIGAQLNDQFLFQQPSVYKGLVVFIEENISSAGAETSIFKKIATFFGDEEQQPAKRMAFVYIDQIHDDIKTKVSKTKLTRVVLTGNGASSVKINDIIEMAFSNADYSIGTFLRIVNRVTTDDPQATETPGGNNSNFNNPCKRPSTKPKTESPSSNQNNGGSEKGTLPKTDGSPPTQDTSEKPSTQPDPCPTPPEGLNKPLDDNIPGIPSKQLFLKNLPTKAERGTYKQLIKGSKPKSYVTKERMYPKPLINPYLIVVHTTAGPTSINRTVKILNGKDLSVHFLIGTDGEVIHGTSLGLRTIAQGTANGRAISIELPNVSGVGPPEGTPGRYTPCTSEQLRALWDTCVKIVNHINNKIVEAGGNKTLTTRTLCSEVFLLTKDEYWFGILPRNYGYNKPGIVAHGSLRQSNKDKQHSDGRAEVYYCQLRHNGMSHVDAYDQYRKVIPWITKKSKKGKNIWKTKKKIDAFKAPTSAGSLDKT